MCFDARKNIFMSDVNAQIVKYDVAADRLVFTRRSPFSSPWNRTKRHSWIANLALAEDGFIYGTHYATDRLFRFDPERENLEFDDLGPGVPGGVCGALRGLTPDGRGHLYYQVTLFGKGPSLFVRYHLRTGRKDVLGRLRVGGINLGSWIGVMDRRGRLYVKGGGRPMSLAIYTPPSRSRL
jgi:hypothetical protein